MAQKKETKGGGLTNKEIAERWESYSKKYLSGLILDPGKYSDEEIDEMIREAGGDPEEIDKRSREQAREIWARWRRTK